MSDAELETQMLDVFLKKLAQVPTEDKKQLAETAAEKGLTIQTSFPLSAAMQEKVRKMIHQHIAPVLALHFEQLPALICGINLKGPGFKLEWNIESYLAHIDEQLAGRLAVASLGE